MIIEYDTNLLFGTAPLAYSVEITEMRLHVPKLAINIKGLQLYTSDIRNNPASSFCGYHIETHGGNTDKSGTWKINSNILKQRHAFIWIINIGTSNSHISIIFIYDTYDIGPKAYGIKRLIFTSLQLVLDNKDYFPQFPSNTTTDNNIMYRRMLEVSNVNNSSKGSFMNFKKISKIYSSIYFDLTKQETLFGNYPIALRHKLVPNTSQSMASVISEKTLKISTASGKTFTKRQIKQ